MEAVGPVEMVGHHPVDPEVNEDFPPRTSTLHIAVVIGIGGAIGALGRYAISFGLPDLPGKFPIGTFIVNCTGSVVLGAILTLLSADFPRHRSRAFLCTGVLGGYTTFSTLSVETLDLLRVHHVVGAFVYMGATVIAGLVSVVLGIGLARSAKSVVSRIVP